MKRQFRVLDAAMRRAMRTAAVCAALLTVAAAAARAVDAIRVPFSFRWGDPPGAVEDTVSRAKARVVEKKKQNGRVVYVVQGHPDKRLQQSLFYFQNEALVEIELQYADSTWDAEKFSRIFEETRRSLDRKYGQGRNIARQRMLENGVVQTIVGYQWTQQETTLRLFMYSAERNAETFRMLSYHYRGY